VGGISPAAGDGSGGGTAWILAAVAAYADDPPSHFDRWRRIIESSQSVCDVDSETGGRRGASHPTAGAIRGCGRGRGAGDHSEDPANSTAVTGDDRDRDFNCQQHQQHQQPRPLAIPFPPSPRPPPPSLTWDQHAVFLQYPPSRRRRTAPELPRG
jgi:hypothetical protein